MDNFLCTIIAGMLIAMTACLMYFTVRRSRVDVLVNRYVWVFALIILWNALEIAYYNVRSETLLRLIHEIKLSVAAFAFVMFFLAVMTFFKTGHAVPAWTVPLLFIPPAVTMLLAVANNGLITREFHVTAYDPVVSATIERGAWFYVITGYMALFVPAIAAIILHKYRTRPKAYRGEGVLALISLLLFSAGSTIQAFAPVKGFEGDLLVAMGGAFFYITIELNGRAGYLQIERSDVFDYLDAAVLLLGPEGHIIDMNKSARGLMNAFGEDGEGRKLEDFLAEMLASGKILRMTQDGATADVYVSNANYPIIYRMYRHEIAGQDMGTAWAYVSFEDVTRNQLLVERLQSMAGVDALTGLHNRFGYMDLMRKMDLPANLPISVIMGDVNGLKHVNDTYGHSAGDRFLVTIASAIKSCCNENCYAARIGGDEFVVLATHCSEEQSEALMQRIHSAVGKIEGLEQSVSIALGCATKTSSNENINALLNRADRQMYSEKR